MRSYLENVVLGAFATLQSAAGIQVTYRRGSQSTTLAAVPAMSRFSVEDGRGFKTNLRVNDFLVLAADLQFDGQPVEPKAGDQIEVHRLDGLQVYRVMSPGAGEPDWKYSDTANTRLRIHTKFVETIA